MSKLNPTMFFGTSEHHRTNQEMILTVKRLNAEGHSPESIALAIEKGRSRTAYFIRIALSLDETLLPLLDEPMKNLPESGKRASRRRISTLSFQQAFLVAHLPVAEQRAFVEEYILPQAGKTDRTWVEIRELIRNRNPINFYYRAIEEVRFTSKERDELDALCREYQGQVRREAFLFVKSLPMNVQVDDLVQAGLMALCDSWRRFDPSKGKEEIWSFALTRIRGAFRDCLRKEDHLARSERRMVKRLDRAINGNPRIERASLTKELRISLLELEELLLFRACNIPVDPNSLIRFSEESGFDVFRGDSEDPAEIAALREGIERMKKALAQKPRLAEVFRRYFEEGEPGEVIAKALKVTPSRISQLVRDIEDLAERSFAC